MKKFAPYAKAFVAAGVAGLGSASVALNDGHVSASEWVTIASATLVAFGAVFGVKNADA